MKKLLALLVFTCLFFSGCKDVMLEKNIKEDVQSYLNSNYQNYSLEIKKVTLNGDNNSYTGISEIYYDGKSYNVPIEVKGSSSSWEWKMKWDVYIIKEEAEKSIKDLVEENFTKSNIPAIVEKVTLFSNGENTYKGLISINYLGQSRDLNVEVNHSYDSGIMFNIPQEDLSFLNN